MAKRLSLRQMVGTVNARRTAVDNPAIEEA